MSLKRIFDLTLLTLAAPLVVPLIVALALLALCAHGRPIFFRQERMGRDARRFLIWKLRSMTCEPDVQARRPTSFGRWMRERGLDEMPQLWNVLLGDMSLVGPRPLTPADCARLSAACEAFALRLAVPPGLMGPAQVTLAKGAALTTQLEARYAERASLLTDVGILFRTVWMHVVGKRRGAAQLPEGLKP
jgi:lipopolysaccharide/colanic/teichoic acid biosynthesis glycosyltransferase